MYHIYITVSKINLAAVASINNTSTILVMYVLFQSIAISNTMLHNAITNDDSIGLTIQSNNHITISQK